MGTVRKLNNVCASIKILWECNIVPIPFFVDVADIHFIFIIWRSILDFNNTMH